MAADPKSKHSTGHVCAECAMIDADTSRAKTAHFLEMQRRVAGITFQKGKAFVRELLDRSGERLVAGPKIG